MMRFSTVRYAGTDRIGVVNEDEVALLPQAQGDLVALISRGEEALSEVERLLKMASTPRVPLAAVRLLAPIRRFRRDILCTGWNYWDHFTESIGKREGQEVDRPTAPTFFTKGPDTVIGPRDDIAFDARVSAKWDYEAELVVIIGKQGRSIPAHKAMDHVWGYCLANDVSQRDLQRRHGGQWLKGKSIDRTMPLGPWIVPAKQIDVKEVRLQCLLNGEIMQDALIKQMAFSIEELIAELSFGMTLEPGDVLLTGTPSGIGNAREPQILLKAGDEVVVRADGLGELSNRMKETDLFGYSCIPQADHQRALNCA